MTANGVPELVAAMDREEITITMADEIAKLPPERQRVVVAAAPENRMHTLDPDYKVRRKRKMARHTAKITLPYSIKTSCRMLVERWGISHAQEMIEGLQAAIEALRQTRREANTARDLPTPTVAGPGPRRLH